MYKFTLSWLKTLKINFQMVTLTKVSLKVENECGFLWAIYKYGQSECTCRLLVRIPWLLSLIVSFGERRFMGSTREQLDVSEQDRIIKSTTTSWNPEIWRFIFHLKKQESKKKKRNKGSLIQRISTILNVSPPTSLSCEIFDPKSQLYSS